MCLPWFNIALGFFGAVPESARLFACLDDVAVMGQAVKQCHSHLGVPEHGRPLSKLTSPAFVNLNQPPV